MTPSNNGHLNEKWGVFDCEEICAPTIIGIYTDSRTFTCYRSLLCEREEKNCWFAQPQKCSKIPVGKNTLDSVRSILAKEGLSYFAGMDPIDLVRKSHLSLHDKLTLLGDLLTYPDDLSGAANYIVTAVEAEIARINTENPPAADKI